MEARTKINVYDDIPNIETDIEEGERYFAARVLSEEGFSELFRVLGINHVGKRGRVTLCLTDSNGWNLRPQLLRVPDEFVVFPPDPPCPPTPPLLSPLVPTVVSSFTSQGSVLGNE